MFMFFFGYFCLFVFSLEDISLDFGYSKFREKIKLCYVLWQDYRWWWSSFTKGGSVTVFVFLYSIHYFVTKLTITDAASTFLYFGYTLIMLLIIFLFSGESILINVFIVMVCNPSC